MKCKTCGSTNTQPIPGYPYCKTCVTEQREHAKELLKRHSDMKGFKLQDEIEEDKPNRARSRTNLNGR